jgi:hypothetical protein
MVSVAMQNWIARLAKLEAPTLLNRRWLPDYLAESLAPWYN